MDTPKGTKLTDTGPAHAEEAGGPGPAHQPPGAAGQPPGVVQAPPVVGQAPAVVPAPAAVVQAADTAGQAPDAPGQQDTDVLAELIRLTATGDQRAFARLYQLTAKRVYGMARRVLVDPELAQDTTQETYLQAWQAAAKFDPEAGSPLAWLMTIAHRRAVDKVRSTQSATDREARYGAVSQMIDHDEVVERVSSRLEAEAVVRCLGTLTETQQESVRLAYYGGLTYREVAERLGTAVPTIKSRIRDGLLRLKNCLGVS